MLKKILIPRSSFDRYFKEADDDDNNVSVTVAPRKNRGTDYDDDTTSIRVAPHKQRGTSYDADDDAEDTGNAASDNETETNDQNTDNADNANDATDNTDNDSDGPADDEAEDYSAEDDGGENNDDNASEDDSDGPADDEAEDYSAEDDGGGEESNDDEGSNDNNDNQESDNDKAEKQKKYNMYKRFLHLYDTIDNMIERSQNILRDDPIDNIVIKTFTNNLNDIHDNMYDYMTLKFKDSTYVQILIYFETIISIIRLNFELLRNNHINLKQ